jgi:polysaccharide export outer membrane protein
MRISMVAVGCVLAVALAGCFSANPEDLAAFTKPQDAQVTADTYILQPPDEITVISSKVPELQGTTQSVGHTQVIRPDGKISFEIMGDILVAGKTPREVAAIIEEKMTQYYKFTNNDNPIDVRVKNRSKYYYICGEIRNAGAQFYTGRETTLSALAKGVVTTAAWEERVQVIRPSKEVGGKSKIFEMNLKKVVEHGQMATNVLLEEGDIIYVPPTILASIGRTVGEVTQPIFQGAGAITSVSGVGAP